MRARIVAMLVAVALAGALGFATTTSADLANIAATGTNNAKITISVSDATADFGNNLDPSGLPATGTSDTVTGYADGANALGAYYKWASTGAAGLVVVVKSNKAWDAKVEATENAGVGASSGVAIANGSLRWTETEPSSYATCNAATPFVLTDDTMQNWKINIAKGVNTYTQWYCLRINWTDEPGTFSSTITYSVAQR